MIWNEEYPIGHINNKRMEGDITEEPDYEKALNMLR